MIIDENSNSEDDINNSKVKYPILPSLRLRSDNIIGS